MQSSYLSESSESLRGFSSSASCGAPTTSDASRLMSKQKSTNGDDLGVDDPKQARLRGYPVSTLGAKKRCFRAVRYQGRDWLEYSVKFDAAFCFPFRIFESKAQGDFGGTRCKETFTTDGYRNCNHATEMRRGFSKHTASKEHIACYSNSKEKIKRSEMGKEIILFVNTQAIQKKLLLFFSTLIDIVTFLATHQLLFKGKIDAFESKDGGKIGLFLSMLNYTVEKTRFTCNH